MRALRSPLAVVALLTGCSAAELPIELEFPDLDSREATTGIVVTAVEPFATGGDEFTARRVVKCGEIAVFPPVAKFNRDGAELSGIDVVRINRDYHRFPLEEDWSLDVAGLSKESQSNPWRALLVHFEARGPAQAYDGEGLGEVADATLLEGCFCVRLEEEVQGADPLLDEQIKEHCPSLASNEGEAIRVQFQSVAPEAFKISPCGVNTLTAPRGQRLAASPSVCLRTISCDNAGGQSCFQCEFRSCSELDDLRNVPLSITVEGGGGSVPVGDLLLSDTKGRVVPEIDVADCNAPFKIRVAMLGRPSSVANFDVECVSALAFEGTTPVPTGTAHEMIDSTTLPGALDAFGGREPAQLALLFKDTSGLDPATELHMFELAGDALTGRALLIFPNETPRAVLGYHYVLGDGPGERSRPLLAVATSRQINGRETMVVRVYEWDGTMLVERRASTQLCDVCSCTRPRPTQELSCLACSTRPGIPECAVEFKLDTKVSMTWSDLDGDGYADLSVGASSDFPMVTYYSSVLGSMDPTRVLYPPDLDASCACSQYGKLLGSFELLRFGGPNPVAERLTYDFLVGNVTGAFALYALGEHVDGRRCDPAQDHEAQCGAGAVCEHFCANSAGRCVLPCDRANPACNVSKLQTTCTSTAHETEAQSYFCGGPTLRCDQPNSVWKLVNVQYMTKGQFTDSGLEDLVAIGSTSPAPGADDRGLLRIIYGDLLNLTQIDNEPMEIRNRSYFDLSPLTFEGRAAPQGPRSAEVGDFNGDSLDDLAVLYGASEEVHVWLGGENRGPGEVQRGIILAESGGRCFPEDSFAVGDFDRDGRDEIVVICRSDTGPRIRRWVPSIE